MIYLKEFSLCPLYYQVNHLRVRNLNQINLMQNVFMIHLDYQILIHIHLIIYLKLSWNFH
jgi:hypothetical protein